MLLQKNKVINETFWDNIDDNDVEVGRDLYDEDVMSGDNIWTIWINVYPKHIKKFYENLYADKVSNDKIGINKAYNTIQKVLGNIFDRYDIDDFETVLQITPVFNNNEYDIKHSNLSEKLQVYDNTDGYKPDSMSYVFLVWFDASLIKKDKRKLIEFLDLYARVPKRIFGNLSDIFKTDMGYTVEMYAEKLEPCLGWRELGDKNNKMRFQESDILGDNLDKRLVTLFNSAHNLNNDVEYSDVLVYHTDENNDYKRYIDSNKAKFSKPIRFERLNMMGLSFRHIFFKFKKCSPRNALYRPENEYYGPAIDKYPTHREVRDFMKNTSGYAFLTCNPEMNTRTGEPCVVIIFDGTFKEYSERDGANIGEYLIVAQSRPLNLDEDSVELMFTPDFINDLPQHQSNARGFGNFVACLASVCDGDLAKAYDYYQTLDYYLDK